MLSVKKEVDKLKEANDSLNNIAVLLVSIHVDITKILVRTDDDLRKKIIDLLQKLSNRLREI